MAELTRQFLRAARRSKAGARLAFGEPSSAFLALRMAFWVAVLSVLIKVLPLPRALKFIAPKRPGARVPEALATQERIARLLDSVLSADFFVFTPICWKRAPVLHRYLALNGIETRVVFGVCREGEDALSGHAWLEANGKPILETTLPDYIVTYSFPC